MPDEEPDSAQTASMLDRVADLLEAQDRGPAPHQQPGSAACTARVGGLPQLLHQAINTLAGAG